MNFSEFIKLINKDSEKTKVEWESPTQQEVELFQEMISCTPYIKSSFEDGDVAKAFILEYPKFMKVFDKKKLADLFYTVKNGFITKGVPAHIWYIIEKGKKEYPNTPMLGLWSVYNLISKEAGCEWNGYTVLDIASSVYGNSISLFSEYKKNISVISFDGYKPYDEVLVECRDSNKQPNGNYKVALIDKSILNRFSDEEIASIYPTNDGLRIGKFLLRTSPELHGLTKNDFDLRVKE